MQQMLGHSSATMTMDTHGHLFENRLDEVADGMDAARSSAPAARKSAVETAQPVAQARFWCCPGVPRGRSDRLPRMAAQRGDRPGS